MKKLSAAFIIALMLLGVTACGGNADQGTDGNVGNNDTNSMQQGMEDAGDDMKDAADDIMGGSSNGTNNSGGTGGSSNGTNNSGGTGDSSNGTNNSANK